LILRISTAGILPIIPNGVEIPQLSDSEEYLKKLGLQSQRYILSVGRFVPEKVSMIS